MNFQLLNQNNDLITCKIIGLFTHQNDNYIIYTDGTIGTDDKENVLASKYEINDDKLIIKPLETEYEWDLIDKYLKGE